MTIAFVRELDLDALVLDSGGHDQNAEGRMCLLEAAAYVAGEEWTDRPTCVCPTLAAFGRNLNDRLPDDKRQQLKPLIPELLGTAGDGHREQRGYMALDWLIRVYLPAFLSLTERIDPAVAQQIRELPPITDLASARAAGELVREARQKASAAGAAAGAAARAAAGDAARDAARAAAWDAARDAAGAAAGAAARAAAGAAAGAAARAAAWDAAGDAARDAAGAAAWDAARAAARAAAWDAAQQKLAPTVSELQDSAIDLLTGMVRIGRDAE